MDKQILGKSLWRGILTGICSWLIYGLIFRTLIDGRPIQEGLFSTDGLVFLAIITVVEIVAYYFTLRKREKE